ncbi:MAG: efflux RND transporter periplasmic adaptor subunit [Dokdonella sp.]|uniref:efflux RND transporter periplasmic adaptor subunit n=1 Tax=Dokdonella sp. TaxID=2291710 RepID=UPI003264AA03
MSSHSPIAKSHLRLLLLAAGIAVAFIVAGCSGHAAPTAAMPPPPEVSVAPVLMKNVRQWDDFTGRVAAVETVELRARVTGYVDRVAYTEGQDVKKGDLLFVIDQRSYRAELLRTQAELAKSRSEAQLAQSQNARSQALLKARAVSREESDTRQAAVAQSNAAVRAAEAAVSTAQLNLTFTEVRSPIAGRTGRALITAGNLAQADTTILTSVVSMDPMYVDFEGDESAYLRYNELARKGERAATKNPVRIGLANETGYPHLGVVDFIDNRIDSNTGTIHARAVLANPDHVLSPGLFARVQLEGSAEFKAMLVDDKAILTDQDRRYVYVLGPDNKALRKDIVTGRLADGLRIVTSGLAPEDAVIVEGMQKVFFPGMPVQPKTVAMQSPAGSAPVAMK